VHRAALTARAYFAVRLRQADDAARAGGVAFGDGAHGPPSPLLGDGALAASGTASDASSAAAAATMRAANPKAEVRLVWLNSWFDPAREREAALAAIATSRAPTRADLRPALGAIACPTLVVGGADDQLTRPSAAARSPPPAHRGPTDPRARHRRARGPSGRGTYGGGS
jgi:pimeloyl-ACP methyl ester carboxylesterase